MKSKEWLPVVFVNYEVCPMLWGFYQLLVRCRALSANGHLPDPLGH
jgi:hypothetical protein